MTVSMVWSYLNFGTDRRDGLGAESQDVKCGREFIRDADGNEK